MLQKRIYSFFYSWLKNVIKVLLSIQSLALVEASRNFILKRKQIREQTNFYWCNDSIYKLRCTYVYAVNMTFLRTDT